MRDKKRPRADRISRKIRVWSEIFCDGEWIHVDPISGWFDEPSRVEASRGRGDHVAYVVSFEASNRMVDVTRRYAMHWSKTLLLRLPDPLIRWWNTTLLRARDSSRRDQDEDDEVVSARRRDQEDMALEIRVQHQAPPTSENDFRHHPIYCLEKFLGKFECLYPRQVVGAFKGKPYFLRSAVHALKSKTQWRKVGRQIIQRELETPAKVLKTTKQKHDETTREVAYYGLWQTQPRVAQPLIDGIVPRNAYGNFEVWSETDVPSNARHLLMSYKIAENLGISYARAMVGFSVDTYRGKPYPTLQGIVVAQEHVALLQEAAAMIEHQKLEKALQHNQKIVYKRWKRMIRGIRLRARLQNDYGPY